MNRRHYFPLLLMTFLLALGQPTAAQDTPLLHIDVVGTNRAAWNGDESRIVVCHLQDWMYYTTVYDAVSGNELFSVQVADSVAQSWCPQWRADGE